MTYQNTCHLDVLNIPSEAASMQFYILTWAVEIRVALCGGKALSASLSVQYSALSWVWEETQRMPVFFPVVSKMKERHKRVSVSMTEYTLS